MPTCLDQVFTHPHFLWQGQHRESFSPLPESGQQQAKPHLAFPHFVFSWVYSPAWIHLEIKLSQNRSAGLHWKQKIRSITSYLKISVNYGIRTESPQGLILQNIGKCFQKAVYYSWWLEEVSGQEDVVWGQPALGLD